MSEHIFDNPHPTQDTERPFVSDLQYEQRRGLDLAMEHTLGWQGRDPTAQGLHLWMTIRKFLRQFSLDKTYSEAHVLNTVYLRGVEAINTGKCVIRPYGWLRSAAYNYIRECSRAQNKMAELNEEYQLCSLGKFPEQQNDCHLSKKNLAKLQASLQKLNALEQKIIILKIGHSLSWKDIQKILEQEGFGTHRIPTLRKQKSRALNKLRRHYDAL